jgi:hypothetical protein
MIHYVYIIELIGVINKTKKFIFHIVKYEQFSVIKIKHQNLNLVAVIKQNKKYYLDWYFR